MNQEIRQLALRGEWLPENGKPCYAIWDDGHAPQVPYGNNFRDLFEEHVRKGYKFFPDEQTRTEYKEIGDGTWVPKDGDEVYAYNTATGDRRTVPVWKKDYNLGGVFHNKWVHFPSEEQLGSFIAKRKGEEPEVLREFPQGVTNSSELKRYLAKPQTITICISDEAIERTIQALHGREIGAGEMQDLKRDAKIFVALLHTEYTLQNQA